MLGLSIKDGGSNESHFVAALASSFVLAAWLTSQTSSDLKPRFEVATIKANRVRISALNKAGNRFVATGQPLRSLIAEAYRVRNFQILGGPNWIDDDQWDIEAKAEPGIILGRNPKIHTERVRWLECFNR